MNEQEKPIETADEEFNGVEIEVAGEVCVTFAAGNDLWRQNGNRSSKGYETKERNH
jgi:hypothetical protein